MSLYIAGMDTTAHLLGMTFYISAEQPHIQEKAIKEITATDIKINYSGRTDAGVHALQQIAISGKLK